MITQCTGGPAKKLVDARFVRPLSERERADLESHLVGCASCVERYRRLQLADRAAAHVGDDLRAISPVEVERIAGDLGLFGPAKKEARLWFPAWALAFAAAAAVLIAISPLAPREELIERGGAELSRPTFAAYVIGGDGKVRAHRSGEVLHQSEHLKLRVSRPDLSRPLLPLFIYVAGATPAVVPLEAPRADEVTASVPGAFPLSSLPKGRTILYLVAARAIDRGAVDPLVKQHLPPEEIAHALGEGATVERLELEVE
jgi:hypothetical protein